MIVVNRKEALEKGLDRYFTGKPCKNGGIAERYTIKGSCLCNVCSENKRIKTRQWALENADYWDKYKLENSEHIKQRNIKLRLKNKERYNAVRNEWLKSNPEKARTICARRRAKQKQAVPSWYSELDRFVIHEAYDLVYKRKNMTNIKWHVDHMIPFEAKNACGLHTANNIQVIPERLNVTKVNRMILTEPLEWIRQL